MLTPRTPPPEDYYQNNCRTLVRHVLHHCRNNGQGSELLDSRCIAKGQCYLQASDDAQRLFARILTRKGPWIRCDTLQYAEVGDTFAALTELEHVGLINLNPPTPADRLLNLLKKDELIDIANIRRGLQGFAKRANKQALISRFLSTCSDHQLNQLVGTETFWLAVRDEDIWDEYLLLFFGDTRQDWSTFVMQDLGLVTYAKLPLAHQRYDDRTALNEDQALRLLATLTHRLEEHPDLCRDLTQALSTVPTDRWLKRRRDKALLRIANFQERQGVFDAATETYRLAATHPAREREVRILHKLDRPTEADILLNAIRTEPLCEEESQFAERFGRRGAGFQPLTLTENIQQVDKTQNIEHLALDILKQRHGVTWGIHAENAMVRTLCGLIYWEALFAPVPGAFTNPFQVAPHDLQFDDFLTPRKHIIDEIEHNTSNDADLLAHMLRCAETNWSIANALINWPLARELLRENLLQQTPAADIRALAGYQIRNLAHRRTGFPDLLVTYADGTYELLEVKGPGDQLQPGQRVWFKTLNRLGIPARVMRLRLKRNTV